VGTTSTSSDESRFAAALAFAQSRIDELLQRLDPAQLAAEGLQLRREVIGADLVIPHRSIAGLGLSTALGPDQGSIYWVHYSTLERSDAFDYAVDRFEVASFRIDAGGDWADALTASLAGELEREITVELQCDGRGRVLSARAYLHGFSQPVWKRTAWWRRLWARASTSHSIATSFSHSRQLDLSRCPPSERDAAT
jgi:hypothetical protein